MYREKEGLNTKRVQTTGDRPSSNYYVEFSINQSVPMSWRVDGFVVQIPLISLTMIQAGA